MSHARRTLPRNRIIRDSTSTRLLPPPLDTPATAPSLAEAEQRERRSSLARRLLPAGAALVPRVLACAARRRPAPGAAVLHASALRTQGAEPAQRSALGGGRRGACLGGLDALQPRRCQLRVCVQRVPCRELCTHTAQRRLRAQRAQRLSAALPKRPHRRFWARPQRRRQSCSRMGQVAGSAPPHAGLPAPG